MESAAPSQEWRNKAIAPYDLEDRLAAGSSNRAVGECDVLIERRSKAQLGEYHGPFRGPFGRQQCVVPFLLSSRLCLPQKLHSGLEQIPRHVLHWPSYRTHRADISRICCVLGFYVPVEQTLFHAQGGIGASWISGAVMSGPISHNASQKA